jgi:alkylation response protein AidB-like acyl-CoA dehydrogenase
MRWQIEGSDRDMDQEVFSALREAVQRFVVERLVPNEDRLEAEDAVPDRDVRLLRIYEGTSQIQQLIIAKALLRQAGLSL